MKSRTIVYLFFLMTAIAAIFAPKAGAEVGFDLDAGDLRFIRQQIRIAEAHAAGGELLGPGPDQVNDPRFPFGLRTVDGSLNHFGLEQQSFGMADQLIPRLTGSLYLPAELFDPDGPGPAPATATSYTQNSGVVVDSRPRVISNLIVDQTIGNPAAVAIATAQNDGVLPTADPLGTLPIGNVAPDGGLSAPFNSMFTFFGQFFDHGLSLVTKGGSGIVFVPLQPDDPLFVPGSSTNFMVLTRATNQPGPDGVLGTADDIKEGTNKTTPFVDQNQTYTSHPSHQVFLREYIMNAQNRPVATGKLIDGAISGNIGSWAEVKAQARTMLGINLVDTDVLNVPLLATDPYGRFLRGTNGFPQIVTASGLVEGNPAAPISTAGALRTGHAFLDDIAHHAAPVGDHDGNPATPSQALSPDLDPGTTDDGNPATYDDEMLNAHFITGDGRGNENIALTAVHTVFHAEHNRLAGYINALLDSLQAAGQLSAAEVADWRTAAAGPQGWDYGERLFQAARFVTEMQYQHLVFEEFARKLTPGINPFIGDGINFVPDINPAISAEFSHAAYRLGHSMLTETISRTNTDGSANDITLLAGFLNPVEFNNGGTAGVLTAAQAAGAMFQGGTQQPGAEIDEFVTEAVRNNLLGLPLDLATINIARGRSEGLAGLNAVRQELFLATSDTALLPYADWLDFGVSIRHPESLVNFIAAYGIHPTLQAATTLADKRAAAAVLAEDLDFLFGDPTATGLNNVDLWNGGLAERIAPFGALLGSTFTFIFERQLEDLQNADRFYYLERLDGLNLLSQLEGNSLAELIMRNTSARGLPADVFSRPDVVFNLAVIAGPLNTIVDDPGTTTYDESNFTDFVVGGIRTLNRRPDGTFRYSGALHVNWIGNNAATDRIVSSEGDDTLNGNGGNDIIEGGSGNDLHIGGSGDDILTDLFGDDVIKGGPGHDAISGGSGLDLLQGNAGNDFIVAGVDLSEIFGGLGNDVFYMGRGLSESIGGSGDDWMEGTESPASIAIGDNNNQFQNDPNGGHDVGVAGLGDMDFDMEGGDDICVLNVNPTHRCEGMLGFDWGTYRGETQAVDADMLVTGLIPGAPINEVRDRFDLTEGLSGTNFDDLLRGDNRDEALLRDDGLTGVLNGHVLTAAGIARISGLAALLPAGATEFAGGNIILGGPGSDLLEGRGGNDILDGDAWLNVQLRAVRNDGTVRLVNTLQDLRTEVFAGLINPGNISIVRSIVPGPSAGNDTAVFSGPRADYTITVISPSVVTVSHQGGTGVDGVDTVRNIEQLRFTDQTIPTPTVVLQPAAPVLSLSRARDRRGGAAITSRPLNIAANSLLVAFVSADSVLTQTTQVNSVTNNGVPLTWTLARRSNVQGGTAEIWWALSPTARPNFTATANLNRVLGSSTITVVAALGAQPTLVGAGGGVASGNSTTASVVVNQTRQNSWIFMVATDPDTSNRVLVPGAGQAVVSQFSSSLGNTLWLQRTTSATTPVGVVTMTTNKSGAAGRWNVAAVEIRPQP